MATLFSSCRYKFPVLYINQFYPRPGTPAAKMKRVPTQDVKQRTKQLTELFHSYEPFKKRIGQTYKVLVTEVAHDKHHYVGHNEYYEQVLKCHTTFFSIESRLCHSWWNLTFCCSRISISI